MKKIIGFIVKNRILLLILVIGLFLRTYKPLQQYMYGHDQDLAGWIVKDILINGHFRLIGQETSSQGVFIGPLFYYLQIPFYLVAKMAPTGTIVLVTLLGIFSIFSFYFSLSKIFNKKVGLIAAVIYAIGIYFIFTDREVAPTMPVHLWSVWFFYGLWQILKGKSRTYLLLGLLLGIAWNFNLALVILTPLILLAQILSKKKFNLKHFILGVVVFIISFSPFIVFELRHSFRQTKAIVASVSTSKDYVAGTSRGIAKMDRVFQLMRKNTSTIVWGRNGRLGYKITILLLIGCFLFLIRKKVISKSLALIMFGWLAIYVVFFTVNSINLSEYYLNGMNVIWITIMAVFLSQKFWGYLLLVVISALNLFSYITGSINRSGYLERKALVDFIKSDSQDQHYPCVSVSYITSPGNNLGYRYLFWLVKLPVNQPKSGGPVYSIVFPHSMVNKIDKSFGALGLILPEYKKYTDEGVKVACSGPDSNLIDPMGGYTQ